MFLSQLQCFLQVLGCPQYALFVTTISSNTMLDVPPRHLERRVVSYARRR